MATPTQNSISVTNFNPNGYGIYTSLLHGTKWGGPLGTGVQLTWSFPEGADTRTIGNYSALNEWSTWSVFTATERAITTDALAALTTVCGLSAVLVDDNVNTVGELRFAGTLNGSPGELAHAYFPVSHPSSGDVWMLSNQWHTNHNSSVVKGTYDFMALMHEIGHAVGLKHPFDNPSPINNVYDSF